MPFIKLPILLFSFLLCFFLQTFCMLKNTIILPTEMIKAIALHATDQTYINIGRTSTSHYTIFNDATFPPLQRNYIQQLVRIAQRKDLKRFDRFIKEVRPCIKNEINSITQFFQNFSITKKLSLRDICRKSQKDNNSSHPLKIYGIKDPCSLKGIIKQYNFAVANLIFHQGYPTKYFTNAFATGENSLMHLAVIYNNIEALDIALNTSPSLLNSPNQYGFTPIGYAMLGNTLDAVDSLVKHPNLNINQACAPNGDTPLMYAFRKRMSVDIIDILLNNTRINLNLKNNAKKTALDIAQDNKNISWVINKESYFDLDRETDEKRLKLLENKIRQQ